MSILGSFIAGVSGINAQSQSFATISDNIANVNTIGYKNADARFATLVAARSSPTNYAPGVVMPRIASFIDKQGLLQSSANELDVGIMGRGFFPVASDTQITAGTAATDYKVTRQGDFRMDKDGYLVNASGFKLLGVAAAADGTPPTLTAGGTATLVPVQFATTSTGSTGTATTAVEMTANLPATDTTASDARVANVTLYDASGNAVNLSLNFKRATASNTWTVSAGTLTPSGSGTVASQSQTLVFDSSGVLTSPTDGVSLGTITLTNGSTLSPTFDFSLAAGGGLRQQGDAFAVSAVTQNGKPPGSRTGVTFAADGTVSEEYSTGASTTRFVVPLINYTAINGLNPLTGNIFEATTASGTATVNPAGSSSIGMFTPSSLETSTVDLAEEFTDMIVTQRAYSANTKSITTADEMYQSLTHLGQ